MTDKPYKGRIANWAKREVSVEAASHYPYNFGYIIAGDFLDHPQFAGLSGHTSLVVSHDEDSGEIETLNSKYKLV